MSWSNRRCTRSGGDVGPEVDVERARRVNLVVRPHKMPEQDSNAHESQTGSRMTISTRTLCDIFLVVGVLGFACCLLLHYFGSGNPSLPISIEYSNGNPLAISFVWSVSIVSAISAILYWRFVKRTESLLMACVAFSIGLIAMTSHSSAIHQCALCLTLFSMTSVPTINVMRGDISFGTIVFVSLFIPVTLVLAMVSAVPESPFGLGIAERIWFVVNYLTNAWILDVLRADTAHAS